MLLVVSAGLLQGCRIGDTEYVLHADPVVIPEKKLFTMDHLGCSEQEARLYLANYKNLYGKIFGIDLWTDPEHGEKLQDYVEQIALDQLSKVYIMNLLAEQRKVQLTEVEKQQCKSLAKQYYDSLTYQDQLYLEFSQNDLETFYAHYILAEKVYKGFTNGQKAMVSEDEARVVRVLVIHVRDQAAAVQVEERLTNGEDFATVAIATNAKDEQTERTFARGILDPAVEAAVFELENNKYSARIQTADGYYFYYCKNKFDETLTRENMEKIRKEKEKKELENVCQNLVQNTYLELDRELWKGLFKKSLMDTQTDSFFALYKK